MAIQANFDTDDELNRYGVIFENCYWQIVGAFLERKQDAEPKHTVNIIFRIYYTNTPTYSELLDATEYLEIKYLEAPIADVEAVEAETFLDKCYRYAMQHPYFEGATAV